MLWSLTTSGVPLSEECLEATGTQASVLLCSNQWHTISVSNSCWAFGCAPYYHSSFFSALADVLLSLPAHSPLVEPRLLSTVAWACARTSYYHPHLMNHIAGLALTQNVYVLLYSTKYIFLIIIHDHREKKIQELYV